MQFQLSADAERLMTVEYRNSKVSQIMDQVPDVDRQAGLSALQCSGWDVASAVQALKIDKLVK